MFLRKTFIVGCDKRSAGTPDCGHYLVCLARLGTPYIRN